MFPPLGPNQCSQEELASLWKNENTGVGKTLPLLWLIRSSYLHLHLLPKRPGSLKIEGVLMSQNSSSSSNFLLRVLLNCTIDYD